MICFICSSHFLVIAFCLPNGVGCTNTKLLQWMDISMFVWKQHLHINVVFKLTRFSRTFQFQRKNIPEPEDEKTNDLKSLMTACFWVWCGSMNMEFSSHPEHSLMLYFLIEYGVFYFPLLYVKHGMTWSRLHGAGQAILTCIYSQPTMRTIATIIIIIMVLTAITTIINIMTISLITILPQTLTPSSSSQAILTCIDSQPTMTTGPSSIIPWG